MAEARLSQDECLCSVCLDLLKDPVSITCGHSYCRSCISRHWDQEDRSDVYSCPLCRKRFTTRPSLATNINLAEMVDKQNLKPPAECPAPAGDVPSKGSSQTSEVASEQNAIEFLDKHFDSLIQRVSTVMLIADTLKTKGLMHEEVHGKIAAAQTRQDKMKLLLTALNSEGGTVKAEFYRLLKINEPYLVKDLESATDAVHSKGLP